MSAKLLLRLAAVLMLLHTIGHVIAMLTWKQAPDAQNQKVVAAMQDTHFQFGGKEVSYGSFYEGSGINLIFTMLLITLLLWILSANKQPAVVAALTIFLFFFAVTEYIYFFPFAATFSFLACICAGLSLFTKHTSKKG